MSQSPRRSGISGYYHIIIRGNGKQILFECDRDRMKFLSSLQKYSDETDVTVTAYCLMENHVHILAHHMHDQIPVFMKKVEVSYAKYYNLKYERTGHLFESRYFSEPVDTEKYLLSVFRYILCNPLKTGCLSILDYPWSSCALYDDPDTFVDTSVFHTLLGSRENYRNFILSGCNDETFKEGDLRYEDRKHDDEWALAMIHFLLEVKSATDIKSYSRQKRNQAIVLLLQEGLTYRQIERLTGISRSVIRAAVS